MRFVETPFGVEVKTGNAFVAGTAASQEQARIFAIYQYPGIVFGVVAAILQPGRTGIYGLLDNASPVVFVDTHEQRFAMHSIRYREMAFIQDTHGVRVV